MAHIMRIDEMLNSSQYVTNWHKKHTKVSISELQERIITIMHFFDGWLSGYGNKNVIDGLNNDYIAEKFNCDDYDIVAYNNKNNTIDLYVLFNHNDMELPTEMEWKELNEETQKIIYDDFIDFMNEHFFENMSKKTSELL